MLKKCQICETVKEYKEFYTCGKYKDKQYYRNECINCYNLHIRKNNPEQMKIYRQRPEVKERSRNNKKTEKYLAWQRNYERKRLKENPILRLKKSLRDRVSKALKAKRWAKNNTLHKYLGCSLEELRSHLEKQFTVGMTWDNYGHGNDKWTIDHIIPLSSAKNLEDLYKLCYFSNLQPLWYKDNILKSDKFL